MISHLRSEKSPINSKRIANIIEYLTFEAFRYTCRGLYENHKFLFTLQLALKISLNKGTIRHDEFQVLIKGMFKGSYKSETWEISTPAFQANFVRINRVRLVF